MVAGERQTLRIGGAQMLRKFVCIIVITLGIACQFIGGEPGPTPTPEPLSRFSDDIVWIERSTMEAQDMVIGSCLLQEIEKGNLSFQEFHQLKYELEWKDQSFEEWRDMRASIIVKCHDQGYRHLVYDPFTNTSSIKLTPTPGKWLR